ncbi:hypothetical protein Mgra_00005029 [Meloidogyne graminicola]|uniref:Uncharacterized protein n=1 Tax=Meloidogyne graminicola TaxID=189291 RepID=A0A8S9ZQG4_9BILA|nr:hypothetical protein Mgra_00005029 [Meloidogyne graminicola]
MPKMNVSSSLCSSTSSTRQRRSNRIISIFQMITRILNQRKYAAKPVLTIYVVQMLLIAPFIIRSGVPLNLNALMKPFHRMYAKGIEFDINTLIMISSS